MSIFKFVQRTAIEPETFCLSGKAQCIIQTYRIKVVYKIKNSFDKQFE